MGQEGATQPALGALSQPRVTQDAITCTVCLGLTPERQLQSLRHVSDWLAAASEAEALPAPAGDLTIVSAVLDCENCRQEPPFRRDGEVRETVTPHLRHIITSFTMRSVETEAALATHALRWLLPEVHLEEGSELPVGPAARHALIVANNLVCAAQPGAAAPGAAGCDIAAACEPSLAALHRAFQTGDGDAIPVSAADLVVIHWVRSVVARILSAATQHNPQASRAAQAPPNTRGMLLWLLGVGGAALLLWDVVFTSLWALLLGIVAIGGWGFVWWKVPRPKPARAPAPAAPDWLLSLQGAIRAKPEPYDQIMARLSDVDLLGHAEALFADTVVAEAGAAAELLRKIQATPCGQALIKWIARKAAHKETLPRLCEIGEALLNADVAEEQRSGLSDSYGAEITGLLVTEFINTLPERGEKSLLWSVAAEQHAQGEDDARRYIGMPRLLRLLMLRAAAIEQDRTGDAKVWSVQEGRFIMRCRQLAVSLLAGTPLLNPHWHLLRIRMLGDGLRSGGGGIRFPAWTGCSLTDLCTWVEDSYRAHRRMENQSREGQSAADMREQVAQEAWAVMGLGGFLRSPEFLDTPDARTEPVMSAPVKHAHSLPLDLIINHQLRTRPPPRPAAPGAEPAGGGVRPAGPAPVTGGSGFAQGALQAAAELDSQWLAAGSQGPASVAPKKGPRKQRKK